MWTTLGQHFTSGMETLVAWIVWLFKWFLKGVWEGYFSGHARSSSGRPWNTANKKPNSGAPNENIVQNRLNIALLNVF